MLRRDASLLLLGIEAMRHDTISDLECSIRELVVDLKEFASAPQPGKAGRFDDISDLLDLIHKPGWTTPAELFFVKATVESMRAHVRTLATLRTTLLEGARTVSAAS